MKQSPGYKPLSDEEIDKIIDDTLANIGPMLTKEQEEIERLTRELEEAKTIRLSVSEQASMILMGDMAKFLEEAAASDVPRVTSWKFNLPIGETADILHIWAATSHDSPISRAHELRRLLDEANAKLANAVQWDEMTEETTFENGDKILAKFGEDGFHVLTYYTEMGMFNSFDVGSMRKVKIGQFARLK